MSQQLEFTLLYAFGFALFEFAFARYFSLHGRNIWYQGSALLVTVLLASIKYASWYMLLLSTIFALFYVLLAKVTHWADEKDPTGLEKYLLKNAVVLIALFVLYQFSASIVVCQFFTDIWNHLFSGKHVQTPKYLLYAIGYLIVLDGGTMLVKGLLNKVPKIFTDAMIPDKPTSNTSQQNDQESLELKNAGEMIGIVEWLLILTFVLAGSYEAVAFSVAAKSIARYTKLDKQHFAEYYLLGTSASVGVAVAVGAILNSIG
ncbi:MAG: hypothetical protein WCW35_08450 [Bacteroidota bacterium]